MNYAWEVILQADKEEKDREKIRFTEAGIASPYIETAMTDLNQAGLEEYTVEINPLYRFAALFSDMLVPDMTEMKKTREIFLDVCMHYISQLDLREGLTRDDYYARVIDRDITAGRYGFCNQRRWACFTHREKKDILAFYLHLLRTGNYIKEFGNALISVYSGAFVYENNESDYELLIYLGVKETEKEHERILFLTGMFLPMPMQVYIFYEHHFGIIDVDETMMVDEMVVF